MNTKMKESEVRYRKLLEKQVLKSKITMKQYKTSLRWIEEFKQGRIR